jgi:hypothetical protein
MDVALTANRRSLSMLILFLFAAIAIYMGLYFAFDYFNQRLDTPTSWLASLNRMFLYPDDQIFFLFRALLLLMAIYVVFDLLRSAAKSGLKRKPPPEEMKLKENKLSEGKTKR